MNKKFYFFAFRRIGLILNTISYPEALVPMEADKFVKFTEWEIRCGRCFGLWLLEILGVLFLC